VICLFASLAFAVPSAELAVPVGAPAVAARLAELELAIRDPSIPDAEIDPLGHAQERIYIALAQDPALRGQVLPLLPEALRTPVATGVDAVVGMISIVKSPRTDLPAWRIETPAPITELTPLYHEAEAKTGAQWHLVAAVHMVETRFGRIHGTSVAGAQGPMQFMPATWAQYGTGDVNDPHDAILGAGNYLAKRGAPANLDKAIWAYNQHTGYVTAVKNFSTIMAAEPLTIRGFHGWEVEYRTTAGWLWLPIGYSETVRVPIAPFCEARGATYCPP
jgi:hypothetical protein